MSNFLNNLPEFLFMGSVLWFYILTIVFVMVLFISEVNKNGYLALVSFIIFSLVMSYWGNFYVVEYFTLTLLGIYLVSGFIYSFIRTYFYGRKRGMNRKKIVEKESSSDGGSYSPFHY